MRFPLDQHYVTNPYGRSTQWYKFHTGCDYRASFAPLYAPFDGTVMRKWTSFAGGLSLEIKLKDNYSMRFMHLSDIKVQEGWDFKEGGLLAYTGNSGHWTSGAHFHLEILNPLGIRINPEDFWNKYLQLKKKGIKLSNLAFLKLYTDDEIIKEDKDIYLIDGVYLPWQIKNPKYLRYYKDNEIARVDGKIYTRWKKW